MVSRLFDVRCSLFVVSLYGDRSVLLVRVVVYCVSLVVCWLLACLVLCGICSVSLDLCSVLFVCVLRIVC